MSEIPGLIKTCDELIKRLDELRLKIDDLQRRLRDDVNRALEGMDPSQMHVFAKVRKRDYRIEVNAISASVQSVVAHYNGARRKARKLGMKALPEAESVGNLLLFDPLDLQIRLGCIQIREYLKDMTDQGSG